MTESMPQIQLDKDNKMDSNYKDNITSPTLYDISTSSNSNSSNSNNNSEHHSAFTSASSSSLFTYTVILQPSDNQFQVKTIQLIDDIKYRIGRQSSADTYPAPCNGYFDSKVLSKNHALLWAEKQGGVWIKDTGSSNGTFLNGHRLSVEWEESDPLELKSGDQIDFGIDINDENGFISYHKVACTILFYKTSTEHVKNPSGTEISQQSRSSTSVASNHFDKHAITDHSFNLATKHTDDMEGTLVALEGELQRSQQVEEVLVSLKEEIGGIGKLCNQERLKKSNVLNRSLQTQLDKAHHQLVSYAKKTRRQDREVSTVQKQLEDLRLPFSKRSKRASTNRSDVTHWKQKVELVQLELDKKKLMHDKELIVERKRYLDYEQKWIELEKRRKAVEQIYPLATTAGTASSRQSGRSLLGFLDALQKWSVQVLLGILTAAISILLYALLVLI